MPKESKSSAPRDHRKLPYPAVSSSTSMAPYTITSLSVTPQNAVSPPPSDGNHHSSWSKDNDELLMRARHQGLNWQPIADTYFPNKSANACRKRHERLIEKRKNTDDWDAARMETLAKAYNDVREQMWRILADRMGGEKWQIVESKCMEKGLKTLQNAGRTASRRDRDRAAQNTALHTTGGGGGGGGAISEFDDYLTLSPCGERSRSHPNSDDGFNDSAIGPDADHPFPRPSPQSSHQVPPAYSNNLSYPTPSRNPSPSSFPPPARTFSNASSYSAISSTSFVTPAISTAPLFPSQLPSARQRQLSTGTGQTLPSFSTTFGMPSASKMSGLPVTSMS